MSYESNPLRVGFVVGAPKSATSSMVGMLNCHPRILALYEVRLYQHIVSKYGRRILQEHPSWRKFFGDLGSRNENYRRLAQHLSGDVPYIYLFDKIPTLSPRTFDDLAQGADALIFMVRDVRTWIAKDPVRRDYACEKNAVPAVVDHIVGLIRSFDYVDGPLMHVDFDRFIDTDSSLPREISDFLGVSFHTHMQEWWNHIGESENRDARKRTLNWIQDHRSSSQTPRHQDTRVEICDAAFWDEVLPVFDRYYSSLNQPVDSSQRQRDIDHLMGLRETVELGISDLFDVIDTSRFGQTQGTRETQEMNLPGKVLFKAGVMIKNLAYKIGR